MKKIIQTIVSNPKTSSAGFAAIITGIILCFSGDIKEGGGLILGGIIGLLSADAKGSTPTT